MWNNTHISHVHICSSWSLYPARISPLTYTSHCHSKLCYLQRRAKYTGLINSLIMWGRFPQKNFLRVIREKEDVDV